MKVGIVGATGQVGGVMRQVLAEREFRRAGADELRLFASARSAGRTLPWRDGEVTVEDAATADYPGLDIVLFSAGKAHRQGAGAPRWPRPAPWSSTTPPPGGWTPRCRWWSSEVNPHAAAERPKGIIANPNCTTMAAMPVLRPLHAEAGLTALVVATYQAVSGSRPGRRRRAGRARSARPPSDAAELDLRRRGGRASPRRQVFAGPIAFNVLPLAGSIVDDGSGRDRRGAEAPQREPQDPGHPRPEGLRHLRARAGLHRPLAADQRPLRAAAHPAAGRTSCSPAPRASRCPPSPPRCRPRARTRPTWAGSAPTRRSSTACRCSAPTTTCARAPRSTPCRSPSWSPPNWADT